MKDGQVFMGGKSLYCFRIDNPLRRRCYKLANNGNFDFFILLMILISSIQLALENPLYDPEGQFMRALYYIDIAATCIFIIEAFIKIVSYGFLLNGGESYLRNYWNQIDFVIIVFSIASLIPSQEGLRVLKVLRLLRVLRPLRVISKNQGLKVAIQALFLALPNIINVTIISILFFLIFGIIAVNYFKGTYY